MATTNEVIAYFRAISGATIVDAPDSLLSVWLPAVILQHDPNRALATLRSNEIHAICLLLWVKYHLYRASIMSEAFPTSETGIGYTDPSRTVSSHMASAEMVRKEYEDYTTALGLGRGVIRVSQFITYDPATGANVPNSSGQEPLRSTLLSATVAGAEITLSWVEMPNADFAYYAVYQGGAAGLADPAETRAVVASASLVTTIQTKWQTVYRLSNVAAGTYYFVVTTVDVNGRKVVSNEILATVV